MRVGLSQTKNGFLSARALSMNFSVLSRISSSTVSDVYKQTLIQSRMYPLAALVFFASIAVPMLKMVSLTAMLVSVQTGHIRWLRDRTRLYYIIRWIGRWSMIDIFMEALLGALVQFGGVVTIEPGIGAVAFCAVVILTIFAAETFDPRIMWDAAEERMDLDRIHAKA
jgi:uncharacterized paraquat-inducible protein A